MSAPEKLNLWDRFFNRYRKEVIEQGCENWEKYVNADGFNHIYCEKEWRAFSRNYVKYKIIDRLTGSESIKIEYLN